MSERKIPLIPTIIVAAAIATMIGLGIWQLGRLEEKEALLARYEAAASNAQPLYELPEEPLDALYRQSAFTCTQPGEWNAIAGRNDRDQSGYVHIISCPGADVVLGWARGPDRVEWAGGEVTGIIAPGGEAGWRLVADPPLAGLQPNATPDPAATPNNHLAYAGQWFFFALSALVIYVLALRRRSREQA
ncbi:SURF1 family protein [Alteraurantiacibacter aquimixticola]|uniref:SURF1-like protein n=1 Tax=Alteraurantiacibacter aquimixticola TaxID=2489173 RepID=A0A4T3F0H9_9SPHN|nr:SURF1 family protein [Alteraurantiacibacter aquimixticola]TIX50571.1 SURF1 family protein [Alteraurantiacibacter aquimixticola]